MKTKPIQLSADELNAVEGALILHIKEMVQFVLIDPESWDSSLANSRAALRTLRKVKYPSLTDADFVQLDKVQS